MWSSWSQFPSMLLIMLSHVFFPLPPFLLLFISLGSIGSFLSPVCRSHSPMAVVRHLTPRRTAAIFPDTAAPLITGRCQSHWCQCLRRDSKRKWWILVTMSRVCKTWDLLVHHWSTNCQSNKSPETSALTRVGVNLSEIWDSVPVKHVVM